MAKIEPSVCLDNAEVGGVLELIGSFFGAADPDDLRGVSVRNAVIGSFDARGKKLPLQFFEGARFENLQADETTRVFDDEGQELKARVTVLQDGQYQVLDIDPLIDPL